MSDVKLAIIYYSTYGTNHTVATRAAEAAEAAGAEVRLRRAAETAPDEVVESQDAWKEQLEKTKHIPEAEPDDLVWSDGYLFVSPTRYGNAASQMRAFIDTLGPVWQKGLLANKAASAMTSAQNTHGGQETTLQTLYFSFMHWGAILVPPGYTDESVFAAGGNPYGVSITADGEGIPDEKFQAIDHQTKRLVEFSRKLKE
ncbi:MAG: NAD(P)H:quinone oxidoreductase [Myxococcota bacterium]